MRSTRPLEVFNSLLNFVYNDGRRSAFLYSATVLMSLTLRTLSQSEIWVKNLQNLPLRVIPRPSGPQWSRGVVVFGKAVFPAPTTLVTDTWVATCTGMDERSLYQIAHWCAAGIVVIHIDLVTRHFHRLCKLEIDNLIYEFWMRRRQTKTWTCNSRLHHCFKIDLQRTKVRADAYKDTWDIVPG